MKERVTLLLCLWECKLVQPLWKTVLQFLKMLNMALHYPAILLLGVHPRERKACLHRHLCMNVYSSIIHNRQKVETTQMPIYRRLDKQVVTYPHNGMLFSHRKE